MEDEKNPGAGENEFFGGVDPKPSNSGDSGSGDTPIVAISVGSLGEEENNNGNGLLNSAQREAQKAIEEKRGVDIFSGDLFSESEKFVGEDEELKKFYTTQKKEHKNSIRKSLDAVVEFVSRVNAKDALDSIAMNTGTIREFLFGTDPIPVTKLNMYKNSLTDAEEKLGKLERTYKGKVDDLKNRCTELQSKCETAKNNFYQKARQAHQSEKERKRLTLDLAKKMGDYKLGKMPFDRLKEEEYNIRREITKQEGIYRVANLGMKKEKIIEEISRQSEKVHSFVIQVFYWTQLEKVQVQLEKARQLYGVMDEIESTLKGLKPLINNKKGENYYAQINQAEKGLVGMLGGFKGFLNNIVKQDKKLLETGGLFATYDIGDRILKE